MSQAESLPRKANLGCGHDTRGTDWLDVDVSRAVEPDKVVDLDDTPWPFPSDHFREVEARHVLEHFDSVPWGELTRILESGALLRLTYPIGHTRFEDTTHRQFWNWHTAANISGDRKHAHEVESGLALISRDFDWGMCDPEPLARWYTKYRLWAYGPGPWLSQIPGLYGEVSVEYRWLP